MPVPAGAVVGDSEGGEDSEVPSSRVSSLGTSWHVPSVDKWKTLAALSSDLRGFVFFPFVAGKV